MAAEIKKARLPQATCLIHLAAMTTVEDCEQEPERCFELNCNAATKIFRAAFVSGVARFIFVSTSHVYAASKDPLDLASPLDPRNVYAKSKLSAEQALFATRDEIFRTDRTSHLQLAIARVFSVIGESQKRGFLYPNLISRAQRRDYSPLPGFDNIRDFLTVEQVADELLRLGQSRSFPALVNICSGRGTQVGTLAKQVFSRYSADPEKLTSLPGRPGDASVIVGVPTEYD